MRALRVIPFLVIQEMPWEAAVWGLHRNVQRFRGGLVFKAHRLGDPPPLAAWRRRARGQVIATWQARDRAPTRVCASLRWGYLEPRNRYWRSDWMESFALAWGSPRCPQTRKTRPRKVSVPEEARAPRETGGAHNLKPKTLSPRCAGARCRPRRWRCSLV